MALFKDAFDRAAVTSIAGAIHSVEAEFDAAGFTKTACRGLSKLKLKDRVHHIIAALRAHLPADPIAAIAVVVEVASRWLAERPEESFIAWPLTDFVGVHGLDHFDVSMDALAELTPLFSAEFAVRGFIERYPKPALRVIRGWTTHDNHHVRRLSSEGIRPRLPWGRRLSAFIDDPSDVLKIVERLKDDPSEYVRRSVANNLNDIAKDHPDRVVEVCRRWGKGASNERQWIIRHATRTLVKQGHPEALGLLGFEPQAKLQVRNLTLSPSHLELGGALAIEFEVQNREKRPVRLAVDYCIHHVKKNGARTPKVFKLSTFELEPGQTRAIARNHPIRPISTRTYYAGTHLLEIVVNGRALASGEFDLAV